MILLLKLSLAGCQDTGLIEKLVAPCSGNTSQYKVVGQFNKVEGEVINLPKLFPSSSFFIKVTSPVGNANGYNHLPLGVCNLPDNFKKEGLRVILTGKLLEYNVSDNVSLDVSTQPFELSSIQEVAKSAN
jgi:hypothetical protein